MTNFLSGKKKLLTMILGVVAGMLIAFGLEPGEVNVIAGAVVSVVSAVSYLFVEGKIDVERIKRAAEDINAVMNYIGDDEEYGEPLKDPAAMAEFDHGGDM